MNCQVHIQQAVVEQLIVLCSFFQILILNKYMHVFEIIIKVVSVFLWVTYGHNLWDTGSDKCANNILTRSLSFTLPLVMEHINNSLKIAKCRIICSSALITVSKCSWAPRMLHYLSVKTALQYDSMTVIK